MSFVNLQIWAVINLSQDSFYPESRVDSFHFVNKCLQALDDGADVLDIGAESSRPFSDPISADTEWERLRKPLGDLKKQIGDAEFFKRVSVDTYKPLTAKKALDSGVGCINDIRGGENSDLLKAVAEYKAGIVLMHSNGEPKTMQENPYYSDVVTEVIGFLKIRTESAISAGILPEKIIWDCGIGFGKNLEHNLELIKSIKELKKNFPQLMYGISRKSFIGKLLNISDVELRRDPTMIFHTYLATYGASFLRVHDVKETVMIREILKHLT